MSIPALTVALLLALGGGPQPSAGPRPAWSWPLAPAPQVARAFVAPVGPYSAGHRGADLAAAAGQPVLAAGAGVVSFAGTVAGRGVVSVDHAGGLRTTYEPVQAAVEAGRVVHRGARLGTVGATPGHCLPATCLHWGLRRGEEYLDPLVLVGAVGPVRLLPLGPRPVRVIGGLDDERLDVLDPFLRGVVRVPVSARPLDRGPLLARGRGASRPSGEVRRPDG